ncbi:histidine phosphatase family protein [Paenibacillus thermotolerans]|uniref:histidine phosphatase family protein n=1 Tax=Paenibacillus thermotolerans TaxID=3027807 RepID=UPI002367E7A4|nr:MULTISPECIES: histidine phosphatase family protein [unclassified Paenibacillus]
MNTYLYFVRHAESPFSLEEERSRGLSAKGAADAVRAADLLQHEGIDVIVSSSYRRAIDTVKPLADRLGKTIELYEELRERAIASMRYEVAQEELTEGIRKSFEEPDFCLPEGETTRQAQERAIPVITKLLNEHAGKRIAIGTHGNIMTIILQYYSREYGFDFWNRASKPDIYKAEFHGERLITLERVWEH